MFTVPVLFEAKKKKKIAEAKEISCDGESFAYDHPIKIKISGRESDRGRLSPEARWSVSHSQTLDFRLIMTPADSN